MVAATQEFVTLAANRAWLGSGWENIYIFSLSEVLVVILVIELHCIDSRSVATVSRKGKETLYFKIWIMGNVGGCWSLLLQIWWLLKEPLCYWRESPLWEVIHLPELESHTFHTPSRCFLSILIEEGRRSSQTELYKNGKQDLSSQPCSGYDLLQLKLKSGSAKVLFGDFLPWRWKRRLDHREEGSENCVLHFYVEICNQACLQTSLECKWESFPTIVDQRFILTWFLEVFQKPGRNVSCWLPRGFLGSITSPNLRDTPYYSVFDA